MSKRPRSYLSLCAGCRPDSITLFPTRITPSPRSIRFNPSHQPRSHTSTKLCLNAYTPHLDRYLRKPQLNTVRRNSSRSGTDPNSFRSLERPRATPTLSLDRLENTIKTLILDVADHIYTVKLRQTPNTAGNVEIPKPGVRFSGGWVRDKLRGSQSADIDVTVEGIPAYEFCVALRDFLRNRETLKKYLQMLPEGRHQRGPVSIHRIRVNMQSLEHGGNYVANVFGKYVDIFNPRSRKQINLTPPVEEELGTIEEDAYRRDATINALFYNLRTSEVEDYTQRGIEDIRNRVLRTPRDPNFTLMADPVRVLRFIRLAAELQYDIKDDVMQAMRDDEIKDALRFCVVGKHRKRHIMTELKKIIRGRYPIASLSLIDQLGLYNTLFADDHEDVDVSRWSYAYRTVWELLHPSPLGDSSTEKRANHIRNVLFRHSSDIHQVWVIALLAPFISIPQPSWKESSTAVRLPPRVVEVAQYTTSTGIWDLVVLGDAVQYYKKVIEIKSYVLENPNGQTDTDLYEFVRTAIGSWGPNWRACVMTALLQEAIRVGSSQQVIEDYSKFLEFYRHSEIWEK